MVSSLHARLLLLPDPSEGRRGHRPANERAITFAIGHCRHGFRLVTRMGAIARVYLPSFHCDRDCRRFEIPPVFPREPGRAHSLASQYRLGASFSLYCDHGRHGVRECQRSRGVPRVVRAQRRNRTRPETGSAALTTRSECTPCSQKDAARFAQSAPTRAFTIHGGLPCAVDPPTTVSKVPRLSV